MTSINDTNKVHSEHVLNIIFSYPLPLLRNLLDVLSDFTCLNFIFKLNL